MTAAVVQATYDGSLCEEQGHIDFDQFGAGVEVKGHCSNQQELTGRLEVPQIAT